MQASIRTLAKSALQGITFRRFLYRVPGSRSAYLTFDDGPDPRHTHDVLEQLRLLDVQATFFLVGEAVEQHAGLVEEIRERGHTIGLHTHSHATLDGMSGAEFAREIDRNQAAIERVTGARPTLLRPPRGEISIPAVVRAIRRGLTVVHYTVTSNDWKARSVQDVTSAIPVEALRGGEILSFHDNNAHTVAALPLLIRAIRSRSLGLERFPVNA